MAYSLVAETDASSTDNTSVTTAAIDTTGANLIVIAASWDNGSGASTPTDSKGNTWTALTARSATVRTQLFYCVSPTVGSGHTFTFNATGSDFPTIAVQAWSGAAASPYDQESGAAAAQPGSITPSEDNCILVTAGGYNNTNTPSVSVQFTGTALRAGTANAYGGGMAYEIQTTATARNPTWGNTPSTAVMASFKAAAAAAGNRRRRVLLCGSAA